MIEEMANMRRSTSTKARAAARPLAKVTRLMDPVHGLITFERNDCDQLALQLINTPEFQRLRRIKQLGFSEYVFPGATHTRFAHSVGVFNNARRLVKIVQKQTGKKNPDRAFEACLTALLHDIGHSPLSHTVEKAQKKIHRLKKHEEWSAEIIAHPEGEIAR